jgi:hypothetical protein
MLWYRNGLLYVYEIQSGKCLFAQKASPVTMFVSCEVDAESKGGVVAIDQKGRAVHFYVDEGQLVNYITTGNSCCC